MSDFTSEKSTDSEAPLAQPEHEKPFHQASLYQSPADTQQADTQQSDNCHKVTRSTDLSVPTESTENVDSTDGTDDMLPTIGQLTRATAQAIQRFYKEKLSHSPRRVTCYLLGDKLFVWAEGSLTKVERLLSQIEGDKAEKLRQSIDRTVRQELLETIEQQLKVEAITLLTDTCQQHNCTTVVVLLAQQPTVRVAKHLTRYS